ncbi:DUF2521 family protein [Bacillus tianshenii]|nr:DUF2521 family protein [Bacillus tianshenii]
MNVITSLDERRRKRTALFERKMLREISLKELQKRTNEYFSTFFSSQNVYGTAIESSAVDMAVEAYLLGAEMSRFGYYGEERNEVRNRSSLHEKKLADTLFDYISYWHVATENNLVEESIYIACEHFVYTWWVEGFENGVRRYRLRLHH